MSSLTLKGKPSEQTSHAPLNSSGPITTGPSNASSGKQISHLCFFLCLNVVQAVFIIEQLTSTVWNTQRVIMQSSKGNIKHFYLKKLEYKDN